MEQSFSSVSATTARSELGRRKSLRCASSSLSTPLVTMLPFLSSDSDSYGDGSTEDLRFPVDVWSQGATYHAAFAARGPVVGVRLWPAGYVPDWDAANDTWGKAPPPDPVAASSSGGLMPAIGTKAPVTP